MIGVPAFAREQVRISFGLATGPRDALPLREAGRVAAGAQEPTGQAIVGPARARSTPVARIRLVRAAPLAVLVATLGCAAEAREPVPDAMPALEALEARLCDPRAAVSDLAGMCERECVAGVERAEVHAGVCVVHVACDCRRPNLGVRRVARGGSR